MRIAEGLPIVTKSACSGGTWRFENDRLSFSREIPKSSEAEDCDAAVAGYTRAYTRACDSAIDLKICQSVGVAEDRFGAALGMRHQAEDVAAAVADAGDVARGAVRVGLGGEAAFFIAVAEDDLADGAPAHRASLRRRSSSLRRARSARGRSVPQAAAT